VEKMTERESAPNQPPDMEPAIRAIAMPADANGNGDIFGSWIMSQMDLRAVMWRPWPRAAGWQRSV
jgi:acyl-CoA hydrolase